MAWYDDDSKLTHVATYRNERAATWEAEKASKKGWVPSGTGATDGVAMAHYELHAWCLLVLAWVFVPFYARSLVFTMPVTLPLV